MDRIPRGQAQWGSFPQNSFDRQPQHTSLNRSNGTQHHNDNDFRGQDSRRTRTKGFPDGRQATVRTNDVNSRYLDYDGDYTQERFRDDDLSDQYSSQGRFSRRNERPQHEVDEAHEVHDGPIKKRGFSGDEIQQYGQQRFKRQCLDSFRSVQADEQRPTQRNDWNVDSWFDDIEKDSYQAWDDRNEVQFTVTINNDVESERYQSVITNESEWSDDVQFNVTMDSSPSSDYHFTPESLTSPLRSWNDLLEMKSNDQLPTLRQLADLFYTTQKQKSSVPDTVLQWLADNFVHIIGSNSAGENTAAIYSVLLSKILCGCQQFSTVNKRHAGDGLNCFFKAIGEFVRYLYSENKILDARTIGNAISGLKNITQSDGTEALLLTMADHIDALVEPNGHVLCKAILGLQKMTPTPATERLIRAITWHLRHEECPQLNPHMITSVLFGLQNMTLTDAIIDLLWAISGHIFSLDDQRFSSGQVASCSFGMRYMNSDICTDLVLSGIAQQAELLKTERFTSKEVCMTIGGIQNMPNNDCTRLLLKSMEEHVRMCHRFNLVSLSGVISGLRGQSNSPYVPRIIDALTDRIADLDLTRGKAQQDIDFFIADMLNSLNVHFSLDSPIKREHVLKFVITLLDKVYPGRFFVDQLRQLVTFDDLVIELVSRKLIKGNKCDLHRCSYSLAATIARYSLDQFLNKYMQSNNGKIMIVFGRNSHSSQNAGRMETVVREAVETRLSPARSDFDIRWEEPFVVIQGAK